MWKNKMLYLKLWESVRWWKMLSSNIFYLYVEVFGIFFFFGDWLRKFRKLWYYQWDWSKLLKYMFVTILLSFTEHLSLKIFMRTFYDRIQLIRFLYVFGRGILNMWKCSTWKCFLCLQKFFLQKIRLKHSLVILFCVWRHYRSVLERWGDLVPVKSDVKLFVLGLTHWI